MSPSVRVRAAHVLLVTDLLATGVFALEGSLTAANAGVDLFGMLVVGFLTAVGGGMIRDLLLGDVPPAALRSKTYPFAIGFGVAAGVGIYQLPGPVSTNVLTVLDAGGLALFAATGTAKALDHGTHAWVATLLGVITGCGGGVLRDVVLNRVPAILTAQIYALAAALGAIVIIALERTRSRALAFAAGITACVTLRLLSVSLDWNLPHLSG